MRLGDWLEVHPENYTSEQRAARLTEVEYGPVVRVEEGNQGQYSTIQCKDGTRLTMHNSQFRKTRRRY